MKKLALSFVVLCCLALEGNAQVLWDLETRAIIPPYENPTITRTLAYFEGGISVNGAEFTAHGEKVEINLPTWQKFFPPGQYGAVIYDIPPSNVEIRFKLYPDPAHVGKMADIVVAGSYVDINKFLDFLISDWWSLFTSLIKPSEDGVISLVGSLTDFDFLQEGLQPYLFMLDSEGHLVFFQKDQPGMALIPYRTVPLQESHDLTLYKWPLGAGIIAISCSYSLQDGTSMVFNQTPIGALIMDGTVWDTILNMLF